MGGPMYKTILEKVGEVSFVKDYLGGNLDRESFKQLVSTNNEMLSKKGLDEWTIRLLSRIPSNNKEDADRMLAALYEVNAISSPSGNEEKFKAYWEKVEKNFEHLPNRTTTIFPEEARIAYELSYAIRPEHVVVAGSYYNYLTVWLLPGLAEGGNVLCLDVDPEVCRLAEKNMKALGFEDRVKIICKDAEEVLKKDKTPIDLLVLDAYGSHSYPDPRYHGKAIYGPLVKAALPRMGKDSFILAHNAEEGSKDLMEFYQAVESVRFSMLLHTTDNMGIFWI